MPYGHWPSPLSAEAAAAGKVSVSELASDGEALYWLESRPAENGRVVLVRSSGSGVEDISPEGVSIRSRVHEYGGGAVCLVPHAADGTDGRGVTGFAFVSGEDQRVSFVPRPGASPVALTPEPPAGTIWRHGGLCAAPGGRWVMAVREEEALGEAPATSVPPRRSVVALGLGPGTAAESVLFEGHDFYGAPRCDPAGGRVAVVAWDHPDMPWDRSMLEVVEVGERHDPVLRRDVLVPSGPARTVASGCDESVGQPTWAGDGSLWYVSDRTGWWHPYRHTFDAGGDAGDEAWAPGCEAEFHGADFVLGQTTMAPLGAGVRGPGELVTRRTHDGWDDLVVLGGPAAPPAASADAARRLDQPCTNVAAVCRHGTGIAFIGATPTTPNDVWIMPDLARPARLLRSRAAAMPEHDVARAEPFALRGRTGRTVHGLFFAPASSSVRGPVDRPPPLVVHCHSGPTSAAVASFDMTVQFFASRGFAVASVDYAGSTGYGRAYRCSLWGGWGIVDAHDCADAARHLAGIGWVDGARMAVRGSSAGALTALNAMAGEDVFGAATSWYGVTDLLALAASTHDFEAHYTDRLIGPLPELESEYAARSPVNRAHQLRGAILLFQGLDDRVVPPAQAQALRDAVRAHGGHCEAHFFAGEGHSFRRADTIAACLRAELDFYLRELGL